MLSEENKLKIELSKEELKIIKLVREVRYGEVDVIVKEGIPIRVEIKHSVSLKDNG